MNGFLIGIIGLVLGLAFGNLTVYLFFLKLKTLLMTELDQLKQKVDNVVQSFETRVLNKVKTAEQSVEEDARIAEQTSKALVNKIIDHLK